MPPQVGVAFDLASFKNSREYARKATTTATTLQAAVNGNAGAPTLILPADINRTYATVYNRHATDGLRYLYRHAGDPVPLTAQILADGFDIIAGAAIDLESPEEVYAISVTVNAIPIDIDVGAG